MSASPAEATIEPSAENPIRSTPPTTGTTRRTAPRAVSTNASWVPEASARVEPSGERANASSTTPRSRSSGVRVRSCLPEGSSVSRSTPPPEDHMDRPPAATTGRWSCSARSRSATGRSLVVRSHTPTSGGSCPSRARSVTASQRESGPMATFCWAWRPSGMPPSCSSATVPSASSTTTAGTLPLATSSGIGVTTMVAPSGAAKTPAPRSSGWTVTGASVSARRTRRPSFADWARTRPERGLSARLTMRGSAPGGRASGPGRAWPGGWPGSRTSRRAAPPPRTGAARCRGPSLRSASAPRRRASDASAAASARRDSADASTPAVVATRARTTVATRPARRRRLSRRSLRTCSSVARCSRSARSAEAVRKSCSASVSTGASRCATRLRAPVGRPGRARSRAGRGRPSSPRRRRGGA